MTSEFRDLWHWHHVYEPDGCADEKRWRVRAEAGQLIVEAWNDAGTGYTHTIITRRGAVIENE